MSPLLFAASSLAFELFCALSACALALVLSTLGAVAGAVGGVQSGCGLLHGSIIGSIVGSLASTHISAFWYSLLDSDGLGIGLFVPFMETTSIALKCRLDAQHRPPPIENPNPNFQEGSDSDGVEKVRLTAENIVETLWNGGVCSICLQDFELEDCVACVRLCRHVFHSRCIRRWTVRRPSCPLCRLDIWSQ